MRGSSHDLAPDRPSGQPSSISLISASSSPSTIAIGSVSLFADSVDFLEDASLNFLIAVGLGWSAENRAQPRHGSRRCHPRAGGGDAVVGVAEILLCRYRRSRSRSRSPVPAPFS